MSEWTLDSLGKYVTHTKGFAFKSKDYKDSGVPIIKVRNFTSDSIDLSDVDFISKTQKEDYNKVELELNDVIIATVGSWLTNPNSVVGKTIRVPSEANGSLLNQNAVRLRAVNGLDQGFLFYLLRTNHFKYYIVGTAQGSANQASITLKDIFGYSFNVPPLSEQKAIAHILGKLDDKIELNRKMNETLEGMAQALFKSWFVDFDPVLDNALATGNKIPEALQVKAERRKAVTDQKKLIYTNPELAKQFPNQFIFNETLSKWIPEGWEVKKIGEITDNIFSGGTPRTKVEEYWNGNLNWFSSGETRNAFITSTEKTITQSGVENSSTKLANPGDILIASAGQGNTRGQTSYSCINTYINQSVVVLRANQNLKTWLYYNLKDRYDEMRMISDSHSIRGSLTTKLLSGMRVLVPEKSKLIKAFDNIALNLISKIVSNKNESQTLTKLRDTLLPQLISGKVRVPEGFAERFDQVEEE